jgi:cysteinyl-tRNA synthetase
MDKIFGLGLDEIEAEDTELPETAAELIRRREEARAAKNWERADLLRDELLSMGITVKDTSEGTQWKKRL